MKSHTILLLAILGGVGIVLFVLLIPSSPSQQHTVMEQQHPFTTLSSSIEQITKRIPILASFLTTRSMPPRAVYSEADDTTWYVGFVQEGSGVPFIDARCFSVDKQSGEVKEIGPFDNSKTSKYMPGPNFSPRTCSPSTSTVPVRHESI